MDECIQVKQSWEPDTVLEEEGPLDEGPEYPESSHWRTASDSSNSVAWSTRAGPGSPMDIEDRWAERIWWFEWVTKPYVYLVVGVIARAILTSTTYMPSRNRASQKMSQESCNNYNSTPNADGIRAEPPEGPPDVDNSTDFLSTVMGRRVPLWSAFKTNFQFNSRAEILLDIPRLNPPASVDESTQVSSIKLQKILSVSRVTDDRPKPNF